MVEPNLGLAVLAACGLDLLLGDPHGMPHPVRCIGAVAEGLAGRLRIRLPNRRLAGAVLTATVVGGTYLGALSFMALVRLAGPHAALAAHVVLIYTTLAVRDLVGEAAAVARRLEHGDLAGARRQVARIVGRDTDALDEAGVTRAAVESVAESTVDGILSPLFYALLGGAPLALAFKAASTLDSMYGYRDAERRDFGWASARLDDVANYVPARIALLVVPLAALVCGRRPWRALRTAWRDGAKHPSPNAGLSEAAFAGALGVRLGGPSTYAGRRVSKPWIGETLREIRTEDIRSACGLTLVATALAVALGVSVRMAVG